SPDPYYGAFARIRCSHLFESKRFKSQFFKSHGEDSLEPIPATAGVASALSGSEKSGSEKSGSEKSASGKSLQEGRSLSPSLLPQVVCSTAINPENPEYQAAIALGCPLFHRSDILAALIQDYQTIAVAGTHGKTTTSSLISYMLLKAGVDPTIIVGGEVNAWEGNARVGSSGYLVAEADESDGSLVKFSPAIGVLTNIELDHPDHYSSLDQVVETFQTFADRCHTLIGSIDCKTVRDRLKPTITYSLHTDSGADYTVDQIEYRADGTIAQVWERENVLGSLKIALLGKHNLSNALAAVAVGRLLGLEFAAIASAMAPFEGARRRFEKRGEVNDILFIDDYAHHPSEIQVTLAAARLHASKTTPPQRVVAIFQPHRYTRTLAFLSEFAASFGDADLVIVSDIYSAGEPSLDQITGQQVTDLIAHYNPNVHYQPTLQAIAQCLNETLVPGDLAIFLGAGNLNQVIPDVIAHQERIAQKRPTETVSPL
ncbi:MAG: UDP-N-acetylmuramate--L-alanine ligase, partial [Leptolyngbyaceae cyanobacterium CSU_1_3]|nr:UDP-N-acetylmuramate--L-alanine ligase [Leptolyngbyaceae cyanobacterium CSU_1_3]